MIGITNCQETTKINQTLEAQNNLIVWLDGTDFINHASTGNTYTITNENSYHKLTTSTIQGANHAVYSKPSNTTNRILITSSSTFPYQNFSMMAWGCKQVNNNYMNLFTLGPGGGSVICEIRLRNANNAQSCMYYAGGNLTDFNLTDSSLNIWHHYAVTYSGNTYKIYLNGVLTKTLSTAHSYTSLAYWILLGCTGWSEQGGQSMATDYRCYNTALSATQIQSIYNTGPRHHT